MRLEISVQTADSSIATGAREIPDRETLPHDPPVEIAANSWFTTVASSAAWVLATIVGGALLGLAESAQ